MRLKLIAGCICLISLIVITMTIMQIEKTRINPDIPVAQKGVVDLSHYDFAKKGSIPLSGEWEFYDGKLLSMSELNSGDLEGAKEIVPVPGMWNEYPIERQEPKSFGTGTFHLHILLDQNADQILGIKMTNIGMSNQIFINDKAIGQSGTPGYDRESYAPKNLPYTSFFQTDGNSLDLIIWVSNYDYTPYSGIVNDIYLGTQKEITGLNAYSSANDWIGIVSFLIIGLMFFSIYLYRSKAIFLLYFSLYCFASSVYILTHGEKLLYQILPMLDYRLFARLQYLSAALYILMLLLYLSHSFPKLFGGKITKLLIAISVVFLPVCFVAPLSIQSTWSSYQMTFIQVVMLYVVYLLTLGMLEGIEDSISVGIGSMAALFMVIAAVWDVLGRIPMNAYLPVAQFIFVLSHAFLVAARLSRSFNKVEELSNKLLLMDRQKDDFLARTSHEFKTPLHGIINITKLYVEQEQKHLSESHLRNLNLVIDIANRLSKLVNDILEMTKLKEGKLAIQLEPVSVNRAARDAYEVSRFIYEGNGNQLLSEIQEELPLITADLDRFKQILYNLIDNAMSHTSRGTVILKATVEIESVSISIVDTGVGIEPNKIASIFDPYVQLNDEFKSRDGIGLGLAIVKQLTELQGGKVQVTSKVGEGSCFTVQFPIAKKSQLQEYDAESNLRNPIALDYLNHDATALLTRAFQLTTPYIVNPNGEGTILLVDDNDSNLKLLVDILSPDPYRIIAVKSGQEALDQLQRLSDVDVIILDIMMPDLTGYEVCRRVREHYNPAELPILMLTAAVNTEDSEAALLAGANDFLHKPFQLNEFRARVNSLISMKRSASLSASYEIAFLHAQIKPHFLYNALNTIASYCETESPATAELIISLAKYLRGTLDFSNIDNLIPVEKEISLIKAYLNIECARFPDLNVRYDLDDDLNVMLPPLSMQILVENGVKYGRLGRDGKGEILISAKRLGDCVRFSVKDHGQGMTEEQIRSILINPQKEGSIGLYNLHTRLSRMLGSGLEIESSLNQGTTVSFLIKERG